MINFFKILIISLALFISTKSAVYSQCQLGEEDKGVYDQMRFGIQNGTYSDAKIRAKILITKYGDLCPNLYFDAGWLSYKTQSWWDAVEFLKLSLNKLAYDRNKFEFAYASVGEAYYELGYYKEAVAYLNEAIYINADADYYKFRAMSYYKLEDYTNAMTDFQTAKKNGSDFSEEETEFFWDAAAKVKP